MDLEKQAFQVHLSSSFAKSVDVTSKNLFPKNQDNILEILNSNTLIQALKTTEKFYWKISVKMCEHGALKLVF
jgi:hypothetical protein